MGVAGEWALLPIERPLRDVILECVRSDPRSISAIARHLEARGRPMHRLILTGYLRAMHDMGQLKEKDIPPSKVYQSASPPRKDIYTGVGEALRGMDMRASEQKRAAVFILNRLFNRPVFQRELQECGFKGAADNPSTDGSDVAEARRALNRGGLKVSRTDPAYLPQGDYRAVFDRVVGDLFVEAFGIRSQMASGTQLRLEGL